MPNDREDSKREKKKYGKTDATTCLAKNLVDFTQIKKPCCWCSKYVELVANKSYCLKCEENMYKECRRCKRPLPTADYFKLNEIRCNACHRRYLSEKAKREAKKIEEAKLLDANDESSGAEENASLKKQGVRAGPSHANSDEVVVVEDYQTSADVFNKSVKKRGKGKQAEANTSEVCASAEQSEVESFSTDVSDNKSKCMAVFNDNVEDKSVQKSKSQCITDECDTDFPLANRRKLMHKRRATDTMYFHTKKFKLQIPVEIEIPFSYIYKNKKGRGESGSTSSSEDSDGNTSIKEKPLCGGNFSSSTDEEEDMWKNVK